MEKKTKRNRKHTFYTKDVLPTKVLQSVNKPTLDINQTVYEQTMVVKQCKEAFRKSRKKLIMYLDDIINSKVNKLAPLSEDFLNSVLKTIKNEESEMRSELVGHQASVDMFKTAVKNNEVDDVYLEAERVKRNTLTRSLTDVVKDREILFAALENLKHIVRDAVAADGVLMNIKAEYDEVESHFKLEQEKLKKFTEWQRNPGLMARQTDY